MPRHKVMTEREYYPRSRVSRQTIICMNISEIDLDIEDAYERSSYTEKLNVGSPLGMLESHLLIFQHAVRHSITTLLTVLVV